MERKLIDRINALAHKAKTVGLTAEETAEREKLRNEYRAAFRANLVGTLDNTVIVNEAGEVVRRLSDIHNKK